jgi:hypothetical protein
MYPTRNKETSHDTNGVVLPCRPEKPDNSRRGAIQQKFRFIAYQEGAWVIGFGGALVLCAVLVVVVLGKKGAEFVHRVTSPTAPIM